MLPHSRKCLRSSARRDPDGLVPDQRTWPFSPGQANETRHFNSPANLTDGIENAAYFAALVLSFLERAEIANPSFGGNSVLAIPPSREMPELHKGATYAAVQPPSMERLAPVICAASSLHRNSASDATCSIVINSFVGWAASKTSLIT